MSGAQERQERMMEIARQHSADVEPMRPAAGFGVVVREHGHRLIAGERVREVREHYCHTMDELKAALGY